MATRTYDFTDLYKRAEFAVHPDWDHVQGDEGVRMNPTSGELDMYAVTGGSSYRTETGDTDHSIKTTLGTGGAGTVNNFLACARMSLDGITWVGARYSSGWQFYTQEAGVYVLVDTIAGTNVAGTTIEARVSGNDVEFYLNDVLIKTVTTTIGVGNTGVGISSANTSTANAISQFDVTSDSTEVFVPVDNTALSTEHYDETVGTLLQNIGDWAHVSGPTGNVKTNGSGYLSVTGDATPAQYKLDTGQIDHGMTTELISTQANTFSVQIRVTDENNYIGYRAQNAELQVYTAVAGVLTKVLFLASITPAVNDKLTAKIVGDLASFYVGDQLWGVLTVTDNLTATNIGFQGRNTTSSYASTSIVPVNYPTDILDSSYPWLLAHYALDIVDNGVLIDSSDNAVNGTIAAGITLATGKFNGAATMAGTGDGLFGGVAADYDTTAWTYSFWVKTSTTAEEVFLGQADQNWTSALPQMIIFNVQAGGEVRLGMREANSGAFDNSAITSGFTVNDDTWHHLVFVRDARQGYIYVDDYLALTTSATFFPVGTFGFPTLPNIGYAWFGDSGKNVFYNGELDQIRFYSEALTLADVTTLYEETATRDYAQFSTLQGPEWVSTGVNQVNYTYVSDNASSCLGDVAISSGKAWCEMYITNLDIGFGFHVGFQDGSAPISDTSSIYLGETGWGNSAGIWTHDGDLYATFQADQTDTGAVASGSTIGLGVDWVAKELVIYVGGVLRGTYDFTSIAGSVVDGWYPTIYGRNSSSATDIDVTFNAGEDLVGTPFTFAPPATFGEGGWYTLAASAATITSVDADDTVYGGQTAVTVAGTGFGVVQGHVTIGATQQVITGWTDTSITINVNNKDLPLGSQTLTVYVPN